MKKTGLIFLSLIGTMACAQTNILTFTNNAGTVFSNARVVKIESDGVLFGFTNWQYTRVKFTNMPISLQAWFGYDPEKIRKANEERAAKIAADREQAIADAKAARERAIAEAKAAQPDLINEYRNKIRFYSVDESDFPRTDGARQACKEMVAELKGIGKGLELGMSYNKFSDLLTDKALAVEKVKDLHGEGVPREFLHQANECIDAYKTSKEWWSKKINSESTSAQELEENFMREYWAEADLCVICCSAISESKTNIVSQLADKMAEMIEARQDAVKNGVLEAKGNFDPNVSGLSVSQISDRLKAALAVKSEP